MPKLILGTPSYGDEIDVVIDTNYHSRPAPVLVMITVTPIMPIIVIIVIAVSVIGRIWIQIKFVGRQEFI
jgi:hypothetical protein